MSRQAIAPARTAALSILRAVSDARGDLGDAIARAKASLTDDRDRALATEIALGTLRHRAALDYQLERRLSRPLSRLDPEVADILRLGAFQLLHLTRVPHAAIVNDAVAQTRHVRKTSASGLVNAVLRRLARERDALTWPARPQTIEGGDEQARFVEHLAITGSHPAWLVERWLARYGPDAAEAWVRFDNTPPALTLAVNAARISRDDLRARLAQNGVTTRDTRYSPIGLVVEEGQALDTEAFQEGLFVVQDEASQLVALLADVPAGARVLDACAAPGGKTLVLAAQAGPSGLVIACDVRERRVRLLSRTLRRAQTMNARPVHVSTSGDWPFVPGQFDRVFVDAPCSGLGTVRRDPDIRWRRSPADLPQLARVQVDLLTSLAPLVAPGGRLIYTTCSSEPEEDEAVVAQFLGRHPGFAVQRIEEIEALPADVRAMATPEGYLRTLPHRDGLEAFFGAVLMQNTEHR